MTPIYIFIAFFIANIHIIYSDSEWKCPSKGCCHPKSITSDIDRIIECEALNIRDCMIHHGSICYWDCNPTQSEIDDGILAHQGYSDKRFEAIHDEFDESEHREIERDEPPQSSDNDEPSTADEIIAVAGLTTFDNCGIQYNYELDDDAAEEMLEKMENGQYDDDREVDERASKIFEEARCNCAAIRRLQLQPQDPGILGPDGREPWMPDPDMNPWIPNTKCQKLSDNAIGQFRLSGDGWCSGTLITNQHVITAGHCFYVEDKYQDYSKITFVPAQGNTGELKQWNIQEVHMFTPWIKSQDSDYDIAIVKLSKPVSGICPWDFAARKMDESVDLHTAGYPGDRPDGTRWSDVCTYDVVKTQSLTSTTCDYVGGQSGGPVYDFYPKGPCYGDYVIRCIISFGIDHESNTCARLTPSKVATIMKWLY